MNREQMDLCIQGADLLNGHLRGLDRSLSGAIERQEWKAADAALDPLIHIAGVLVRRLMIDSEADAASAFATVVARCDPERADEYRILGSLLSVVINGGMPDIVTCNTALLAIAAQEIGANAIDLIAETTGEHPLKVAGGLSKLLKAQDPSMQITDSESALAALAEYALDPEMASSRQETAHIVVQLTGKVADEAYAVATSLREDGNESGLAYSGLARVAMTAAALSAGALGMIVDNNHYAWSALLRQVAECEYLLWKFSAAPASVMDWLGSSREEREARWKPSQIYSDTDNDFQQKAASLHCEFGGHPTPEGTLQAGQILTPEQHALQSANGYTHLLQHLHSVFEYAVLCADRLDELHELPGTVSERVRDEYSTAVDQHLKTDKFGPATAHFSDPLP